MYKYRYIIVKDIDEVIMPKGEHILWKDLMEDIYEKSIKDKKDERASYNVRNVYFFDTVDKLGSEHHIKDIPAYMHMFQHVYRAKNYTKPRAYIKCFHNPERVLSVHNHFPLSCLGGGCSSYSINVNDAHLQHYRADCVKDLKNTCSSYKNNTVLDDTILRHRRPVIQRVTDTLYNLGFFDNQSSDFEYID